jgi:hypothetical protein
VGSPPDPVLTDKRRTSRLCVSPKNGENALEVTRAPHEQPIEALGTHRSNKSLGDSIRLWRLNRRPSHSTANRLEHVIKPARAFSIVIADQQANRFRSLGERLPNNAPIRFLLTTASEAREATAFSDSALQEIGT